MKSVRYQTCTARYVDDWRFVKDGSNEDIRKNTWEKTALFVHNIYNSAHISMKVAMEETVWKMTLSL